MVSDLARSRARRIASGSPIVSYNVKTQQYKVNGKPTSALEIKRSLIQSGGGALISTNLKTWKTTIEGQIIAGTQKEQSEKIKQAVRSLPADVKVPKIDPFTATKISTALQGKIKAGKFTAVNSAILLRPLPANATPIQLLARANKINRIIQEKRRLASNARFNFYLNDIRNKLGGKSPSQVNNIIIQERNELAKNFPTSESVAKNFIITGTQVDVEALKYGNELKKLNNLTNIYNTTFNPEEQ